MKKMAISATTRIAATITNKINGKAKNSNGDNVNNNRPIPAKIHAITIPIKAKIGTKIGNNPIAKATIPAKICNAIKATNITIGTAIAKITTIPVTMIAGNQSKIPITERTVTIAPATTARKVIGIVIKLTIGIKLTTNPIRAAAIVKIAAIGRINGEARIPNVNNKIGKAVTAKTTVKTTNAIGIQIGAVTMAIIGIKIAKTGTAIIAKIIAAKRSVLSFF